MSHETAQTGELRTIPLAEIHVEAEFNPRTSFERKGLEELAASIASDGVLQTVLVEPNGEGGYRLIAGERRLRAAAMAGLTEVPAKVRDPDSGGSRLELALIENLSREELNPVEEAKGYRRLMDEEGLTRRGVVEHLKGRVSQKRVSERLQILELPDELHPKVATGEIPPGAIKALAGLAKIHAGLPQVAAARVGAPPPNDWDEPVTWSEFASDPIAVVVGKYEQQSEDLPADVYAAGLSYPLARFSLPEKAQQDAGKLGKLLDIEPERLTVRFYTEDVEQAEALKAAHRSSEGYSVLIVGQDVADQLAGDHVARRLKAERAGQRRRREWERERGEQGDGSGTAGDEAGASEEEQREQRRREREAEQEARRVAAAHNAELGAAVVKGFAKVKLDERVVKLLATLNLGGELDQVAMRGARYGFPGWVEQIQTKGGKAKTVYVERRADAGAMAREYLSVARTAPEVAGRLLALVAMARYADEGAVAQSAVSFYSLPVPRALPWTGEIVDAIDELAAERLPEHLTAKKRAERAEQREQEAEREALRQSIAERIARGNDLDAEERSRLREEIEQAYGRYSPEASELYEQLDDLDRAPSEPADGEEVSEPQPQ